MNAKRRTHDKRQGKAKPQHSGQPGQNWQAHYQLGLTALQRRNFAQALPHLKAALEAATEAAAGSIPTLEAAAKPACAAQAAVQRGLDRCWQSFIDALVQSGQASAAEQLLIDVLRQVIQQGDLQRAVFLAQMMTAHFPQQAFGWQALGVVRARQGLAQQAVEPLQRAATLTPDDGQLHCHLGHILQTLGRLTEAEQAFCHALTRPLDAAAQADVWCHLGVLQNDLGRFGQAQHSYAQSLQLQPDSAMVLNNLGVNFNKAGQPEPALQCFGRALQIDPQFALAHNNLGNALIGLGRLTEAESSLRQALALQPDLAAHKRKGSKRKGSGLTLQHSVKMI